MKNMEAIEKAAETVPVFVRDEEEQTIDLSPGCFDCTHEKGNMSPDGTYQTFLMEAEDEFDEMFPVVGFVVSWGDRFFATHEEQTYWLRKYADFPRLYNRWEITDDILDATESIYVRLVNYFDGAGLRHVNSRLNLTDLLNVDEIPRGEVFVSTFNFGRFHGTYIDPVEDLREAEGWRNDRITHNLHVSAGIVGRRTRQNILAAFPGAVDRLKRLGRGENVDLRENVEVGNERANGNAGERRRFEERQRALYTAITRDRAREAVDQAEERLIDAGQGRRPDRQERMNVQTWANTTNTVRFTMPENPLPEQDEL